MQKDIKILIDNLPVHKTMNNTTVLYKHQIKVIDFPQYLPDLNSIGGYFVKLKRR